MTPPSEPQAPTLATTEQKQPDSSACAVKLKTEIIDLSADRVASTIRINRKLWKGFVSACKKNGYSTCSVLENFISGFVYASANFDSNSPTINVYVSEARVVKRVRRESSVEWEGWRPEKNFYDDAGGLWKYVRDASLNVNGHVVGCKCLGCRSTVKKGRMVSDLLAPTQKLNGEEGEHGDGTDDR